MTNQALKSPSSVEQRFAALEIMPKQENRSNLENQPDVNSSLGEPERTALHILSTLPPEEGLKTLILQQPEEIEQPLSSLAEHREQVTLRVSEEYREKYPLHPYARIISGGKTEWVLGRGEQSGRIGFAPVNSETNPVLLHREDQNIETIAQISIPDELIKNEVGVRLIDGDPTHTYKDLSHPEASPIVVLSEDDSSERKEPRMSLPIPDIVRALSQAQEITIVKEPLGPATKEEYIKLPYVFMKEKTTEKKPGKAYIGIFGRLDPTQVESQKVLRGTNEEFIAWSNTITKLLRKEYSVEDLTEKYEAINPSQDNLLQRQLRTFMNSRAQNTAENSTGLDRVFTTEDSVDTIRAHFTRIYEEYFKSKVEDTQSPTQEASASVEKSPTQMSENFLESLTGLNKYDIDQLLKIVDEGSAYSALGTAAFAALEYFVYGQPGIASASTSIALGALSTGIKLYRAQQAAKQSKDNNQQQSTGVLRQEKAYE